MNDELAELARAAGVEAAWVDAAGYRHEADNESVRTVLRSLGLPCDAPSQLLRSMAKLSERRRLPPSMLTTWVGSPTRLSFALPQPATFQLTYEDGAVVNGQVFDGDGGHWLPPVLHVGYHRLQIAGASLTLAVAPLRACSVADVVSTERRAWGISLGNVDTTASPVDFSRLQELARSAASYGADAFCVGNLRDSKSGSQRWLDPARIAPATSFPVRFGAAGDNPRAAGLDGISALRQDYLSGLPRDELSLREFLRFDRDGGAALKSFALHQALCERHGEPSSWPAALREPSPAVSSLHATKHAEAVGFQIFLQWMAERGLLAVQAAARAAGMAIGIVADAGFCSGANSSEIWSDRNLFLTRLRCADPGATSTTMAGVPYNPFTLVERGFQPFIDTLRASMAAVGGIRIIRFDRHWRAWLRVDDGESDAGAWLDYPFDDLLRLLVLESARQRCLVIVDDVHALPEHLRIAVDQAGLLRGDNFLETRSPVDEEDVVDRPAPTVLSSSGQGHPNLLAWWRGDDIQRRIDAAELSTLVATRELSQRERERGQLLDSLGIERRRGHRKPLRERREPLRSIMASPLDPTARDRRFEARVVDAVIQQLGMLPASLALVDLDDLVGFSVTPGLPTLDPDALSRLLDSTAARNRLNRLDDARRCLPIRPADGAEQARIA